jgi:diaminohydroxyphosphoribosylaminopyrimidine deaminase/5-amino-6-(5-phosphoribosylamino)uracil reductase
MERAMDLARKGIALASPNPCVGAVIVDATDEIVGSGFHTYNGVAHAEVLALKQAGARARGATLYVNMEPCSHVGRTGPCADAVIEAGIRRVVAGMEDPNPQVAGRGFQRLREAGVEVLVGTGGEAARHLNEGFAWYIRRRRPLVILKSAMTLDGKIAGALKRVPEREGLRENSSPEASSSSTTWITGEAARGHVQQLRHSVDAILVGVGTVVADDPLLTDRTGMERRRPLLRVILDSKLRLPLESQIVKTCREDVMVFCPDPDEDSLPGEEKLLEERKLKLEERGVRVERVRADESGSGRTNLEQVMERLGGHQILSVLIEGGAAVNGEVLRAGVADKVFFYYAPKILGGSGSVPFASGVDGEVTSVSSLRLHRIGEDFAIEGYVRDPYA